MYPPSYTMFSLSRLLQSFSGSCHGCLVSTPACCPAQLVPRCAPSHPVHRGEVNGELESTVDGVGYLLEDLHCPLVMLHLLVCLKVLWVVGEGPCGWVPLVARWDGLVDSKQVIHKLLVQQAQVELDLGVVRPEGCHQGQELQVPVEPPLPSPQHMRGDCPLGIHPFLDCVPCH